MQQSGGVNEFDDCGELEVIVFATIAKCSGQQQQQHWPHSFATRADDVISDGIDQRHFGAELVADYLIDLGKIRREDGKEFGGFHDSSILV